MRTTGAATQGDETFAVLMTPKGTYTNVTVTAKDRTRIGIMHASGVGSIAISELAPDIQQKLGYATRSQRAKISDLSAWARPTVPRLEMAQIRQLEQRWREHWQTAASHFAASPGLGYAALGAFALLYLFFCHCCALICRKTGHEAGILVWLPVLQLFPLLRAAGMSPLWFLAFLLPLFNIVAQLVWSVNITAARGKSGWVALLLALPITTLFAFLYLAFSSAAPKEEARPPELMVLQTA